MKLHLLSAVLITSLVVFGCGDSEKKARELFNQAQLLKGDKEESARRYKLLTEVVSKYPDTKAATEAIPVLNSIHGQIKNVLSIALDTFTLDNGRYPTNEEGLNALIAPFETAKNWDGPYIQEKFFYEFVSPVFEYEQDGKEYRLILKAHQNP